MITETGGSMKRTKVQKARLLKLVDLMAHDNDRKMFNMKNLTHGCGTPSCLLGHACDFWPHLLISSRDKDMRFFGISSNEHEYLFAAYHHPADGFDINARTRDTPEIAAQRVLDVLYADVKGEE